MKQQAWDRIGIYVSGVCMVHCLALPIALSAMPMWTTAYQLHGWLHPLFAFLLIPTTLLALIPAYKRHRSNRVVGLLMSGLFLVVLASIPTVLEPGVLSETVVTVGGSILLVSGHIMNWKLRTRA